MADLRLEGALTAGTDYTCDLLKPFTVMDLR